MFAVAYLVFIVAVVPLVIPFELPVRYLLPVYVPLLLVAVLLLDRFLSIEAAGWMAAIRYGLASFVLLATLAHVGFSAQENLRLTAHVYKAGYEDWKYKEILGQHSETLKYVWDNQIEGKIYSNFRAIAWVVDSDRTPKKLRKYRKISNKMTWTELEAGAHIV